ncbi:MAG: DUF1592 domain-containing protein, partial [Verrucomicrobiota bacterium]
MKQILLGLLVLVTPGIAGAAAIPDQVLDVLADNCLDCHDGGSEKGGVNLDFGSIDFTQPDQLDLWLRTFDAIDQGLMPPPQKKQPTNEEREAVLAFLDPELLKHVPIGGALPRRLNQGEYEATIRKLFSLPKFSLPVGFPKDTEYHGFTNVGKGLVLSPSHLEAYSRVAITIADELFPPQKPEPQQQSWTAGPEDMVISFSASAVRGDVLRLASRSVDIMRSCSWPSRIEIKDSGTYRISVDASQFLSDQANPFEGPMILEVRARPVSATDRSKISVFRPLIEIEVNSEMPETTTFEADLYEGETVIFRWANAEMTHEHRELAEQFEAWFRKDQRFHAAWLKAVFPTGDPRRPITTAMRGRNGWDMVSKHLNDPNLDLSDATMDSELTVKFLDLADSNQGTFQYADALCHYYHDHGPSMEFHQLRIEGPLKSVPSPKDLARVKLQEGVLGSRSPGQTDLEVARQMLSDFLPRAFRRPVDDQTVSTYLTLVERHWKEGHSFDDGMHLLLRNILISPRFLYRALEPGKMDDFDLASRLSYFLTQGPPDATLVDLAQRNRLNPDWVLRREAERLLPTKHNSALVQSFVGQWLDTQTLSGIMPDPKFNFGETSVNLAKLETERFFAEILAKNLSMTDFIDPDFTFSSVSFVQRNYGFTPPFALQEGMKLDAKEKARFRRLEIERGGKYGGLLGQASIMMATANGVDTQPVLRGVWVLENLLGMPPPPPPKDVPALTPDTRGT